MTNLNPLELERLKALLSGQALALGEKISTLDMLRSRLPGFFSNLKPELTEENLKDNNFLIKYLTNPYNRNKIKNALRQELSLSTTQQIELEESLEKPVATEIVSGQPGEQVTTAEQPLPAGPATGAPIGGMPNLPSAPRISFGSRRVDNVPQTPEPPPPKSELVTANKSGVIQEAPSGAKLVTASSNGVIKEAPPKQIFIANKQGIVTGVRNIKPPSWLKTFGSNAQIFARKNLDRIGRGLMGAGKAGLGAAAPSLGRAFHGGLNGIERMTRPGGLGGGGGISSVTKIGKSRGKWVFISVLLGMMFLTTLLGTLPGTAPPGQAGPLPPGGGDISNCKFTRGPENPRDASFKSNLLLSYIQEATQKSTIPAAVLAAFIRVESPSSSNMSDEQISNYSGNCAESDTGALGIMQIQPPGTKSKRGDPASCDDCIDAGAKLVGKTVSTLTRADYCDPRTNIIVGGGWILKKMSKLGLGDGTKWDPAWTNNRAAIETLGKTYYGCLNYGGATDCIGPYNYADDVSTSIQNCQAQVAPPGGGSDFASQLVAKIKNSQVCGGLVNISNHDRCIDSIQPPPLPPLTTQAIRNSVFNVPGGVLQCVGFVQAVATDLIGVGGHASDFASPNIKGYNYFPRAGNQIQVGDLPVWKVAPGRPYGHIATVVSMGTNGAFQVAEANFCDQPCGRVDNLRYDSINDDQIAGWLRKQ